jgi:hypothetical protein
MKYDRIFESIVNDFNIDEKELKKLNDVTLALTFKALGDSKLSEDPKFRETVIDEVEAFVAESIKVTSHLEDVAIYILRQVGLFDDRLSEEIESIFDMYDKVYTCVASGADSTEVYKIIKPDLPDIEDWEHDCIEGILTYTRADDANSGLRLEVADIIELMIFQNDTICSVFAYDMETDKRIHDEVIFDGKYIESVMDNIPSEYKK